MQSRDADDFRPKARTLRFLWLSLLLATYQAHAQEMSSIRVPVVTAARLYVSTPVADGEKVGAVSATNSPSTWSITSGDPEGSFAISDSGVLTFTSQGAARYGGEIAKASVRLTILASNEAGSGTGSIEVYAYADGSKKAPSGAVQYPTELASYRARPPWKVAGFDYYVGIPSGTVLSSPKSISNPNVTNSGNTIICSGPGASASLSEIDFTGYFVYVPSGGCSSLTITNSNFACTGDDSPGFAFVQDQNNAALVIRNSKINSGDNCGSWPHNVSDPIACGGSCTIEHNWFYHASERILSIGARTEFRWNLIDNPNTMKGAHGNYHQFGGGTTANPDIVEFNASYSALFGGGEGYQFYGNEVPATIVSPALRYNTMIARKSDGHVTMSYMVHGSCHTALTSCTKISGQGSIAENYFDPSGAYGIFYGGSLTRELGWSSDHNINMLTGNVVTPH
jgi:hypothetical protein